MRKLRQLWCFFKPIITYATFIFTGIMLVLWSSSIILFEHGLEWTNSLIGVTFGAAVLSAFLQRAVFGSIARRYNSFYGGVIVYVILAGILSFILGDLTQWGLKIIGDEVEILALFVAIIGICCSVLMECYNHLRGRMYNMLLKNAKRTK